MGGLVLKSVDEDVCFHPDYDKRGIQCFDEVKSIVVHIIKISLFISSHTCWGAPSYSAVSSWYLGSSSFCHLFDNRALSQMLSLPGWFLFMYSFIVGPQVTVCRRIVSALDPNRFDVTLESFLFGMCWSYVVPQLFFAPERLVTQIARGFNFCVDITIVVIEKGFTWKLLSTKVAHKFRTHFSEICFVLLLLGWLAVTDWL